MTEFCSHEAIMDAVKKVKQQHTTRNFEIERRAEPRHPYPKLVELIPYDNDFETPQEPFFVAGKHLGTRGFDFFHGDPITFKNALLSFPISDDESIQFAMRIDWCRFLGPGWYESGGRFIKVIKPRVE